MLDTIIEGARIFDGCGAPPISTDLALVNDRIVLIGNLTDRAAYERIAAGGQILTPGFIDVHAHSDELWLLNPGCESKILQGVTTEIGGNCGSSIAPLHGLALERKQEELARYGSQATWHDLDTFFRLVEAAGVALNIATLIGLGTTRRCVRGDREGTLDDDELCAEHRLVHEGIEQGGLGISSGLIYVPSRYADLNELISCARVARDAGQARYVSHLRSEGDALFEALDEALEVGKRAEVAVQCSHHKAAGKKNWGKVHESLARIDRARTGGLPVYADAYPYAAMCTNLSSILPEDISSGGREATLERLNDPMTAAALAFRLELEHGQTWHNIMISGGLSERNAELAGLRLDAIARLWNLKAPRALIRLLIENNLDPQAIFFTLQEDDVATVLSAEFTCVGSDASARALSGITAQGVPHPRTYGTFPRIFAHFVRKRAVFDLTEAIRRMTSLPATIFGLTDRGRIEVGAYADLVLFDPKNIADTATYQHPFSAPIGIDTVLVNGKAVVRNGTPTGALPGRALRNGL